MNGSKDVTRRRGWTFLRAGDRLMAVEKAQGLKKGEKVRRLGAIEVVSVRREKIGDVDREDVRREGFGDMKPIEFVRRFLEAHGSHDAGLVVTRIEFKKIDTAPRCEERYANSNRDVHQCRREPGHGGRHVCDVAEWVTTPRCRDCGGTGRVRIDPPCSTCDPGSICQ